MTEWHELSDAARRFARTNSGLAWQELRPGEAEDPEFRPDHVVVTSGQTVPASVLHELVDAGTSVRVRPEDPRANVIDISFLEPFVPSVAELWIDTGLCTLRGGEILEAANRMTQLSAQYVRGAPGADVSRIRSLFRYLGLEGELSRSALHNEHLRVAILNDASGSAEQAIHAPLQDLDIASANRRLRGCPPLTHPAAMERLTIRQARNFDLATLAPLTNLRELVLVRCTSMRNVASLASLPRLEHLEIVERSTTTESWGVLRRLHDVRIITDMP